jgi:hypothetical protein
LPNKGPEGHTLLTVNGRLPLVRQRYAAPGLGSHFPLDPWIDRVADTVSLGLRELACRLNLAARDFDKAAENLARAAQVRLSGELLRQIVAPEGKAIQAAAQAGRLAVLGRPATARPWTPTARRRSRRASTWVPTALWSP